MTRVPTELFDCDRVNSYLDSYLLDQVPPPERRGMRMHIHRCPACFQKVAERDPLQLFAPLADQTPRDEVWEGFWPAIREGIERQETRRQARRVWMRAAAIVVALAGAIAALMLIPRVASTPPMVATGRQKPLADEVVEAGGAAPLPQTVERVVGAGSRDVQVYTMSYTRGPEPGAIGSAAKGGAPSIPATPIAELVLIVDKGLEL